MLKVLLVDDSQKVLDGLEHHIQWESTGCVCVATALNGMEALEATGELQPDIIITDVKMPHMDGLELCRRVHEQFPNIHLIIISAHDEFEYARLAMRYGVKYYILKPIDMEKLAELEALLKNISDSTKKYVENLSGFLDASVRDALATGLRRGDAAETVKLLSGIRELNSADIRVLEHIALQLIYLMYQTVQELNLSLTDENALSAQLRRLHSMRSREQMRAFVLSVGEELCNTISQKKNMNTDNLAQRVNAFIHEHYTNADFSTSLISRKFSISQSYLCHIYKSAHRTNINTYVTTLRMQKACELLSGTGLSIVEVAARVGYLDAHYFTKVFHKHVKMTPSEYRRLHMPS